MTSSEGQLDVIRDVHKKLEQARSLDDVKDVRDRAEAVRTYAQSAKLGLDIQNQAAELKLRAERKAGKMLGSLNLHGGDRRSKCQRGILKLTDLGISPNESARWQREAAVPDQIFERYVRAAFEHGYEITAASLMRLADRMRRNGKNPKRRRAVRGSDVDAVQEARSHLELLLSILERICNDNASSISKIDRRSVLRYARESIALLESVDAGEESSSRNGD